MKNLILIIALLLIAPGCRSVGLITVAEHDTTLAAIKAAETDEGAEFVQWAAAIAKQSGAAPLPDLSAATQDQRDAWYRARTERRDQLNKVLTP